MSEAEEFNNKIKNLSINEVLDYSTKKNIIFNAHFFPINQIFIISFFI